ncbi:protein MTSS 2 isoform X2 [Patella vulgata]|uniref:protein MTSS 2 isoform X2 n=1 Tax=Patella vulgata TaxID=6465 RepID=UPI00217F5979|nr:protein MTSS 2 isoform X2 [Patella vulgata]
MDTGIAIEKECGALGGLFQTIINDMRGSSPVWEDFTCKATKLNSTLKTTLLAISAFLDAFQKVADLATGSRGATKEVGSALTRLCMRHRSIESKLKTLTSSVMDGMVMPLQEKLEDWKKVVVQLDKDHAKEYKKAKHEIKKAASDTMRLQKKMKKGKNDMQSKLDHAMHDVNEKYKLLESTEKNALRTALVEERGRFCLFISCIKPFVDNEVALLTEITHLQEIMQSLCLQASDPQNLPASSEQVITDIKGIDASTFNLTAKNHHQHSPPSSPSSLGSRKSSMCSISSINSSSSGSLKSHSHSPSHSLRVRNISQHLPVGTIRLTSVSSQDSGFTSQDTLFLRPTTPQSLNLFQNNNCSDKDSNGTDTPEQETPTTPNEHLASTPSANSTWNNWPNQPAAAAAKADPNRPHTISSAYEKSHNRPALNKELFEPLPEATVELRNDPSKKGPGRSHNSTPSPYARPSSATITKVQPVLPPLGPKPKPKAVSCPRVPTGPQPIYANTVDLARMVAEKREELEMMESPESERGPTPPTPSNASPGDMLDLQAAIRSLDSCTAALHTEYQSSESDLDSPQKPTKKMQQNSMELAQAIRELEESTAALESTYEPATASSYNASHASLQCSSGYATMNSTPSGSEDTIPSGDFDLNSVTVDTEYRYFTIPRSGPINEAFRAAVATKRPASTAGIPVTNSRTNSLKRANGANAAKPPPPVRRNSSISGSTKSRSSPPKQMGPPITAPKPPKGGKVNNGQTEGPYAELQLIQQSIKHSKQQNRQQGAPPSSVVSTPSPDRLSSGSSSTSSSHYAISNIGPANASNRSTNQVQNMNIQFAAMNMQRNVPRGEEMDFPLPPTDDELKEIEKIYSKPPPQLPAASDLAGCFVKELKRRVIAEDGSDV